MLKDILGFNMATRMSRKGRKALKKKLKKTLKKSRRVTAKYERVKKRYW